MCIKHKTHHSLSLHSYNNAVLIQLHSIKEELQEIMADAVAKMNSETIKISYMVGYCCT
jgi:hypothetical protein